MASSRRFSALALGLALALCPALSGPVSAAPQIVGTFYSDTGKCLVAVNLCKVTFSAIPAGKKLVVRGANCFISLQPTSASVQSVLVMGLQGQSWHLSFTKSGNDGTEVSSVADGSPHMVFTANANPPPAIRVITGGANAGTVSCTLAGDYLPNP